MRPWAKPDFPCETANRIESFLWKSWPVFCMVKQLAWKKFLNPFCKRHGGKKMKRFLLVLGVLALFVTAMACTKQEEPAAPATETEATMPETTEQTGEAIEEEGQAMTEEGQETGQDMTEEAGDGMEAEMPAKE
jgi:hypothetical protein